MDPQRILDDLPMTRLQITAVACCIALNAIDGFDVLAISFSAPGIAAEWGVSSTELGFVLTMELVGMAVGSIFLGNIADRVGRRPIIFGCQLIMFTGMLLASMADSMTFLLIVRFITGLGIGGMLATASALVAEYSNARNRNFYTSIMAAGYPVGIIVGGSIASALLAQYDWRSVFILGAGMTALLTPLVWMFVPESITFLAQQGKPDSLSKINTILTRLGHQALDKLPAVSENPRNSGLRDLFTPELARTTILLTLALLTHFMTFYYILKWIPQLVVDMGYSQSSAGGVLVWANVGGALGSIVLSTLTHYFRVRLLVMAAMAGSVIMLNVFGQGQPDLSGLATVSAITGFFTNSAVIGLFALLVQSFPTHLRAGGTGFVIGIGRGGAIIGPIIAGLLLDAGFGLPGISFVMAFGSLIALLMLILLQENSGSLTGNVARDNEAGS